MLTLITCTGDRPKSFKLLEHWIKNQTLGWGNYQWIVVDDGIVETECSMDQQYFRRNPRAEEKHSLMDQLRYLKGASIIDTPILFIEDDDYYGPRYLEYMNMFLQYYDLVGVCPAKYYNIATHHYRVMGNKDHASLACSGISPLVWKGIDKLLDGNAYLDLRLWHKDSVKNRFLFQCNETLHVGIKCVPGRKGLTHMQEEVNRLYRRDLRSARLIEWCGENDSNLIRKELI